MGMSLGNSGSKNSSRKRHHKVLISEINVTPFVDVILVLLIIFMVAAPLLTVGVPIDLPETAAQSLNTQTPPITVSIDSQGQVHIQDTPIPFSEIVPKLRAIASTGYEERIFIRGDKAANYGIIMKIMAEINAAGFKNIGLVSVSLSQRGS